MEYLDVSLDKGSALTHAVKEGYTTFCYLLEGEGDFEGSAGKSRQLILFRDAESLAVKAKENLRFILVFGRPLNEPIAWGGPIVMNTHEELETAFRELDEGTFVKR